MADNPRGSAGTSAEPWDEMVTGDGHVRAHWQSFISSGAADSASMEERWDAGRRLLFQNGVTYHAYADPQGVDRPWPLDPIPLLMPQSEWQMIAEGLRQRARLLDRVLADLYGAQTLIRDGMLPPALVLGDPGFLRACHGMELPPGSRLTLVATDMVRDSDGIWRVLASRTQAPTGTGYTLENRVVMSQTLAQSFRGCNVERLSPFFEQLRQTLINLAPRRSGPDGCPRLVLLTPGPLNEAYFEHAFLARHLGLTLVEGADLTVRDQAVYLKTLGGLERIDVILRRVDDDFCDPLELRPDSALGVAGLVEAVRAGNVAVCNSLGSGLTDSVALMPWMGSLTRHMLGEAPLLADVPSYWGGDARQRAEMVAGLDRLVFRPAYSSMGHRTTFGPELDAAARAELTSSLRRRPQDWVAQEPVVPSTAPVWRDGKKVARPLVLRAFACATPDGDWMVMPGGLARISADERFASVTLQTGAGAKDVWIVGASLGQPQRRRGTATVMPDGGGDSGPRAGDLPSRAADHLFWVGRYAERADAAVRTLRSAARRLSDDAHPGAEEELVPLLRLMGFGGMIPLEIAGLPQADAVRGMRQALEIVADPANPGGMRATMERLRRAAAGVRDRLPGEFSRVLTVLGNVAAKPMKTDPAGMHLHLDELSRLLASLIGLELDGMSRGPAWRFLVLGRRLERAIGIVGAFNGSGLGPGTAGTVASLSVLLELAAAGAAYRDRHPVGIRREPVLSLLLADDDHPRSLAFQIKTVQRQLRSLPPIGGDLLEVSPTKLAQDLLETAAHMVTDPQPTRDPTALADLTDRLGRLLPEISNLLSQAYFSHVFARTT
ncbi:circularly permuted type 2 ATP-grasp protein [Niveispirillum sp. KHB5.9]|uniref:circularly permuted type 2 ATP-grasp protein n=1 Tax=Niveispirillum sp. KHB5.9 TaxID=3400269 RepID=UPI003A88B5AE